MMIKSVDEDEKETNIVCTLGGKVSQPQRGKQARNGAKNRKGSRLGRCVTKDNQRRDGKTDLARSQRLAEGVQRGNFLYSVQQDIGIKGNCEDCITTKQGWQDAHLESLAACIQQVWAEHTRPEVPIPDANQMV